MWAVLCLLSSGGENDAPGKLGERVLFLTLGSRLAGTEGERRRRKGAIVRQFLFSHNAAMPRPVEMFNAFL